MRQRSIRPGALRKIRSQPGHETDLFLSAQQPYGFTSKSTAEEVSNGIDLSGKVAIVTGSNTGMSPSIAKLGPLRSLLPFSPPRQCISPSI
jgi:hypothetical protein